MKRLRAVAQKAANVTKAAHNKRSTKIRESKNLAQRRTRALIQQEERGFEEAIKNYTKT